MPPNPPGPPTSPPLQTPRRVPTAVPRVSVSQHGPLIMGFSDVLTRAAGVAAVWALLKNHGDTGFAGFEATGVVSEAGTGCCWQRRLGAGAACGSQQ